MNKAHLLVVEDEHIVALDIQNRLIDLGYTVVGVAPTGLSAIKKALELRPDLILMDIKLKGDMDGITASGIIRESLDVPIIYLTAFADETTLERAKRVGPFGYLLKPFEERELHTAIEMALYKHKMEQKLRQSEQWLATTLRSIGDAVIATDQDGHIRFINPVAQSLTGWTQADAVGRHACTVFRIISEHTRQTIDCPVQTILTGKQPAANAEDILLVAKDGTEIPIDENAAPILDDKGKLNGVVLVFKDITQRKQIEQQLKLFNQKLQTRNDDLSAFAHTVAHDLHSPLTPIIGISQTLCENYEAMKSEDLLPYLQSIARNSQKMDNIIEELMLLAQVQEKEVKLRPLSMAKIVADVQHRLQHLIEQYEATVVTPEAWPAAMGYGPWVEEIWANYLSNGIKYGGKPPHVELGATLQPDGMIRFWVKDNGPGIAPSRQTELFSTETPLSQIRATGHGLGLSIVRRIVEKLGGQVGVNSANHNGGAEFYFTLSGANPSEEKPVYPRK
ncbi:MAG: response regulator [Chloroflexi bacterium]|nr:MAG: response regulator [Chloroflexota bacterium]